MDRGLGGGGITWLPDVRGPYLAEAAKVTLHLEATKMRCGSCLLVSRFHLFQLFRGLVFRFTGHRQAAC